MANAKYPTLQGELLVIIRPLELNFWEFEGTREQLEAEGVIPPGTAWPKGAQSEGWDAGRFSYWLSRTRPRGMKGPMKLWTEGDWWQLRCNLIDGPDYASCRTIKLKRELAEQLYRETPAGRYEHEISWRAYWKAHEDTAFQKFKSLVVPERRKPGRPAKRTSAQVAD